MDERKNLLRTYLDGKVPREKQALYALQNLMHKMEHPNSKYRRAKMLLYSINVEYTISDEKN